MKTRRRHYRPTLGIRGRWMHVEHLDLFTDDEAAVTCDRCLHSIEQDARSTPGS